MRQQRLGIDDFGHPLSPPTAIARDINSDVEYEDGDDDDDVPGLITSEGEDPRAVKGALVAAIESAVEADVRSGVHLGSESGEPSLQERTPLLSHSPAPHGKWRKWMAL